MSTSFFLHSVYQQHQTKQIARVRIWELPRGEGGRGLGVGEGGGGGVISIRNHKQYFFFHFTGDICDDNEASCLPLSKKGACEAYPRWMLLTCRKSCGNCGCEDLAANCSSLAKEEKCLHDDHVNWMLRNCQRSCKVCLGMIAKVHWASLSEFGLSVMKWRA